MRIQQPTTRRGFRTQQHEQGRQQHNQQQAAKAPGAANQERQRGRVANAHEDLVDDGLVALLAVGTVHGVPHEVGAHHCAATPHNDDTNTEIRQCGKTGKVVGWDAGREAAEAW